MQATNHLHRRHLQVHILVSPERTPDGEIRLYLGSDQIIDLPGESADELARLVGLYRREQRLAGAQ